MKPVSEMYDYLHKLKKSGYLDSTIVENSYKDGNEKEKNNDHYGKN